jgi:hypothetical protein
MKMGDSFQRMFLTGEVIRPFSMRNVPARRSLQPRRFDDWVKSSSRPTRRSGRVIACKRQRTCQYHAIKAGQDELDPFSIPGREQHIPPSSEAVMHWRHSFAQDFRKPVWFRLGRLK